MMPPQPAACCTEIEALGVDTLKAWAETPDNRPLEKGIYRHPSGWRSVINCVISIPGIGSCQRAITKLWPRDTPLASMQDWRKEKRRHEIELRGQVENTLRARELDLQQRLHERDQEIAALNYLLAQQPGGAELMALRERLAGAEARARSWEEAARRAYRFAASGARR